MLCAGLARREGWKTLDANPAYAPDYLASIPPLPDVVRAELWQEIEWIHGITSLYPWDAATLLEEIRAVLVPGGKLVLEQPDLAKADRTEWMFGDPSLRNPLHMNRWGYTPYSLAAALEQAGYPSIEILPAQHHLPARDFRIEAMA
jgi:hypothetical protein